MKHRSADVEYVNKKRHEILNLLKTQVETMTRFNEEYHCSESSRLTSNVRGINGITLLYAAVEIMADPDLIQTILTLGGNPSKPSGQPPCTPLELAQKRYERCKAKEKDISASSKPGIQQAAAQKTAQAKRLLEILENART